MLPKDVLEVSWLAEYEKNINAIWEQLVRLNSTIFVLEKILNFPFDLFLPVPSSRNFWILAENAFFENCILIIWRVGVDNKFQDGLTLQQLKTQVFRNFRAEEYRTQLNDAFKQNHFDSRLSNLGPKIREIRTNYIAHYNLEKYVNPTSEQIKQRTLLPSELKQYQNTLKGYFDLLCFGGEKASLPPDYYPDVIHPAGVENRSDIERLLDSVAKESDLLNLPEKNPFHWKVYRQKLSDESIRILNNYRTKFDLPVV